MNIFWHSGINYKTRTLLENCELLWNTSTFFENKLKFWNENEKGKGNKKEKKEPEEIKIKRNKKMVQEPPKRFQNPEKPTRYIVEGY